MSEAELPPVAGDNHGRLFSGRKRCADRFGGLSRLYGSALVRFHAGKADREEAIQRMRSALGEIIIEGIETNVDYQYGILQDPDYCSGKFDVEFLNESGKSPASIA